MEGGSMEGAWGCSNSFLADVRGEGNWQPGFDPRQAGAATMLERRGSTPNNVQLGGQGEGPGLRGAPRASLPILPTLPDIQG